ncbi:proline--tRNA ligase [Mollicutes bacterium LVI A0039]|nr:proline--tRNA ligase [Mollicutes bacterium LVI A0039]
MYQSKFLIPTLKQAPKDAKVFSHEHLLRAGYIKQSAAGLYTYLPLAKRTLRKIEEVVRQEIDGIGGAELSFPLMQPSELWIESGRYGNYGAELFAMKDRHGREFAMSPTAEEISLDVVRDYLNSYKKYPLNVYQINTKFRDERRPRFGLLRSREFIMFDGYSYHTNQECLEQTYDEYCEAYKRIFDRLGIEYRIVKADNGSMGGSNSQEFMAICEIGEDTIAYEEGNDLAYNIETAPIMNQYPKQVSTMEVEKVATPDVKSIEQVAAFLNVEASKTLKAVCYMVDGELVIAFCNGSREIEETKLLRALNGTEIESASNTLLSDNGIVSGSIGPIGLENVRVIFDRQVATMSDFVCGANVDGYHLTGVDFDRDINVDQVFDICAIEAGDIMRADGTPISLTKGIEIGHIFALGDRYTSSMGMTFLDQNQKQATPLMGCYGIGISRILTAYIEQKQHEGTVKFDRVLSPFDYHLIVLDYAKNPEQAQFANELAGKLRNKGYSVLIDDRNERVGSKMIDAELIGCSNQIIIGRDFAEGVVEIKNGKEKTQISVEELYA